MEEEAADELGTVQGHEPNTVALGVVLPAEGDFPVLESDEPMVGDGDAMGIATKVVEHLGWTAEGWLGVDNPLGLADVLEKVGESSSGGQRRELSVELELSPVERLPKIRSPDMPCRNPVRFLTTPAGQPH